ncbi:hypothetical protein AOL_s00083g444 [Orbilia oligospora ATCC 24927]|uniref:Uncharacterized protein n=1 Tax=Arthrobotrys oligospora (strain ATCC 24927 / CBS 115.81 / DSM 1491) TaxID=756982 RepID=G1XHG3_ARTOA|nr:hypothetical protein AOL_s00083g444 [Orbilia oligospora ATCC 24927]RBD28805.1 hypothetical protein BRN06_00105 [Xanthomonas oryzae pv. oryzae]EGX47351.1 hypothetical protein AOL_s00083g444 [Orbilia oligospora ATCC 24927]RBD61364.1 hypothetical protein BRM07_00270 [Xanthomonas oryzae pv. oryzae]RBF43666.1 hypothetical protein BRM73_00015 [Xanthomonas oryzae pv. oryzae]RBH26560.1 hypothetical protein BRM15_00025 [Xanthomonas oryzae pv. oryzae]
MLFRFFYTLLLLVACASASVLKYDPNYSYSRNLPLTSFACSDGSNGLITKFKGTVNNLSQLRSKLKPGVQVAAHKFVTSWNSPSCGACFRARNPKTNLSFNFIAIDVARDGVETVIASPEAFASVSPSGTTNEGVLPVYITYFKDAPSNCWA